MGKPLRVLIVEDSEDDTLLIARELKRGGYDPIFERVETPEAMAAALKRQSWDFVIADYIMPHFSGLDALRLLQKSGLDLPFIIVSGSIGEDTAVAAMKAGAHDYVMKGSLNRLVPVIGRELNDALVRQDRKRKEEALRESEKRYRQVIENAIEIIYTTDAKGNFTYANDAALKTVGYSLEELRRFNYLDLVVPEHRDRLSKIYINQFREKQATTYVEFPFLKKSGEIIWFGQNASLVIEDGKVMGFHIIARDITERKRAEEETRLHENRLKNLLDLHRMGDATEKEIFDFTLEASLRTVQSEFAFIGIMSSDEAVMTIHAWSQGAMGQCAIKEKPIHFSIAEAGLWGELVRQRRPIVLNDYDTSAEFKKGYPEGHVPIKRFLGIPIFSADRIVAVAAVANKVSEYTESDVSSFTSVLHEMWNLIDRKQAEEALQESEEKYRTILETIEEGYYEVDSTGNFTLFNDSLCRMLGYTKDELMGMNNRQYMDKETAKKVYQVFNQLYTTGEPYKTFDWEIIRKDGTKRFHDSSVSLIRNAKGEGIGFRGIARDITERKRAEEEMASLQEQFRQSQKIEAIGRLAGGIAHDFNNLLTVIKGYSQLSLIETREGDPLRGNIEEIKKAADRAADLTRQLLAFSRRQIMEMKVLDLNDLLRNLDKMLHRVISEDIELVTVLDENLGRVKTDPGQIEQVIMNLAINARDAMLHGGKLTIETANVDLDDAYARNHVAVTPGRFVMLSASDTGVGMTPEVRQQVFEPFFTTKEKGKGTGLGLSTVYGIVKQSGGNIWVYSEPGRGSTFKIYLPRVDEPLEDLGKRVEVKEIPHGTETILVVEDEEEVLKLAGRILSRHGYRILKTSSANEALEIFRERKEPIHLILTDVVMPQMSGRELTDRCRQIRQDFKVLYMSGYTDNAITHHGVLEKGMNYIQKPFTVDGLARKVREVLDK